MIFLFNVGGYYIAFWALRVSAEKELANKLDQDFNSTNETFLFKLPLVLPYGINQEGYQRTRGSFEHEGQFYQLVKQKIENDTLYIVCIKDQEKKKLVDAFSDYTKLTNDLPTSSHDGWSLLSKLSKDFESSILIEIVLTEGWFLDHQFAESSTKLLESQTNILSPPPESIL